MWLHFGKMPPLASTPTEKTMKTPQTQTLSENWENMKVRLWSLREKHGRRDSDGHMCKTQLSCNDSLQWPFDSQQCTTPKLEFLPSSICCHGLTHTSPTFRQLLQCFTSLHFKMKQTSLLALPSGYVHFFVLLLWNSVHWLWCTVRNNSMVN